MTSLPWPPLRAALIRASVVDGYAPGRASGDGRTFKSWLTLHGLDRRFYEAEKAGHVTERLADHICCNVLRVHPTTIYADEWLGIQGSDTYRRKVERYRARMAAGDPTIEHGIVCYDLGGCRCPICSEAKEARRQRYKECAA